ncbi:hypothetical protein ACFSQ7_11750 [Paenibacillus rhizoplanae]
MAREDLNEEEKNVGTLLLFLILGWLAGAWIAKLLEPVQALSFSYSLDCPQVVAASRFGHHNL